MKRNLIIYGLILLMFLSANSIVLGQTDSIQGKHSLELAIIPSLKRLSYKSADNSSKGALGLGLQFGYTYHLTNRWGVGVSLRYQPFSGTYKTRGYHTISGLYTESNGYTYVINQILNNTEKQRVNYMMIPVLASYRFPMIEKLSLRVAAGAAYGLAFGEKLNFKSGTIIRSAYFPDLDLVVDDLPEQYLGTYSDYINMPSHKQFKNAFMGIAEAGAEYVVNHQWLVSASVNAVFGSDVKKSDGAIVHPNGYSGVTASNYVGAVKPFSIGLSVGIIYRFGRKAPKPVVAELVEVVIAPLVEQLPEVLPVNEVEPEVEVVAAVIAEAVVTNSLLDEFVVEVVNFNNDESIQFNFNERALREETRLRLDRLVRLMIESKAETLIVGHACNVGSDEVNNAIGFERATRVKKYLVELGVPESQIQVESKGEKEPKYPNDSKENRAKNRRVEIIVK